VSLVKGGFLFSESAHREIRYPANPHAIAVRGRSDVSLRATRRRQGRVPPGQRRTLRDSSFAAATTWIVRRSVAVRKTPVNEGFLLCF
jgi:hypothetical protein